MAVNRIIFCLACRKEKEVICNPSDYPNTCHDCRTKIADVKRRKHLAALAKKSIEERLRLLEEQAYDTTQAEARRSPLPTLY